MDRKLVFALVFCAAIAAQGAVIVHDAGRDLLFNSRSASVYTNRFGGVWSYLGAPSYGPASPRQPLTSVRSYQNNVSSMVKDNIDYDVVLLRGPSVPVGGTFQLPVIAVNQLNVAATNYLTASGFPSIPPGQIALHPGDSLCAVLRFTAPRTGVYTVTAKAWNQNVGLLGMSLQTNGVIARARTVWRGSEHRGEVNDLSLAATTFQAGDMIEMTFDKGDLSYVNSNAAGVTFQVAEEVLDVLDAGSVFRANVLGESANPLVTSTGAWQAFYGVPGASVTNPVRNSLAGGYVRAAQGSGAQGFAVGGGLPWCVVNASDDYVVETNAEGKATFCQGRALAPDEIMLHPQHADKVWDQVVGLRFTPDTNGIYDVGLTIRDMAKNSGGDGVNVWLLQGLQVLRKAFVSLENDVSCETIFLRDVPILAEIPIEVVVDKGAKNNNSDATALAWAMVRTGDIPSAYDASAALKACFAVSTPVNPFVYNGCSWTVGTLPSGFAGDFTPYPNVQTVVRFNGAGRGWGETLDTSPFMGVNIGGKVASGANPTDFAVGRGMLYAHPKSDNRASCIRFTAAKRGIYKATMWVKGLNSGGGNGTDVHILTNGLNAASRVVWARGTIPYGDLKVEPFYLRPGGTVTFAVGSNGDYSFDLTGFHAWVEKIEPDGLPTGVAIIVR